MVTTNSPKQSSFARWQEIDFDKVVWVVPAATMKMKRPHRVPLSRQAIVILREAWPNRSGRVWGR
jgi:integrase